jgi:lipoprotein-releasing system ATP-binding protein
MNKRVQESAVLVCDGVKKTYHEGKLNVPVLHGVHLAVQPGEQIAIVGESGAGKSTLLHMLGGLDKPTSGVVRVDGVDINRLSENKRSLLRNQKLGFVYQLHHLLPEFTVLENVCMPLLFQTMPIEQVRETAIELLKRVGLEKRMLHKLGEISGGERQRTAIARALVTGPVCLLADEPTGNLDHKTAEKVYQTMLEMNRASNTSLIIVTHDLALAKRMDRQLVLEDGVLKEASLSS